jgi:phospholipid/cholesterol/gamma-HCH transport system permease protein
MSKNQHLESCGFEVSHGDEGAVTLHLQGRMDATSAPATIKNVKSWFKKTLPSSLTVDLSQVTYLDDFGALVLIELRGLMAGKAERFFLTNTGDQIKAVLAVLNFDGYGAPLLPAKKRTPDMFTRLGAAVFQGASDLKFTFSFIGSVCLALIYVARHPGALRGNDALLSMEKTGVDAVPIVGLISFLLGLIMAFMSSVQLRLFGADIYVASLVGLAMVRELGPIMTAIIVAGRSGSAFAAEIGTMKISEEVDALFTMGFDPVRFLVVPKIAATVIVVPFLTLLSDLCAILGGLVVGVYMLDLTANAYISQTIRTLTLFDAVWGFLKSGIFAFLITTVGCLRGFQVRGGADAVGRATTSAVVSGIFLIILSDSIIAVILRYWA